MAYRKNPWRELLLEYIPAIEQARGKEIVLVIGNTDVGKSTLINDILLMPSGLSFKLRECDDGVEELVLPDVLPSGLRLAPMGESGSATSKTKIPEIYDCLCDTPGFESTEGEEARVMAGMNIRLLTRIARIKGVIIVVDRQSFESKQEGFKKLARTLRHLFCDFSSPDLKKTLLLVITKNPKLRPEALTRRYLPDTVKYFFDTLKQPGLWPKLLQFLKGVSSSSDTESSVKVSDDALVEEGQPQDPGTAIPAEHCEIRKALQVLDLLSELAKDPGHIVIADPANTRNVEENERSRCKIKKIIDTLPGLDKNQFTFSATDSDIARFHGELAVLVRQCNASVALLKTTDEMWQEAKIEGDRAEARKVALAELLADASEKSWQVFWQQEIADLDKDILRDSKVCEDVTRDIDKLERERRSLLYGYTLLLISISGEIDFKKIKEVSQEKYPVLIKQNDELVIYGNSSSCDPCSWQLTTVDKGLLRYIGKCFPEIGQAPTKLETSDVAVAEEVWKEISLRKGHVVSELFVKYDEDEKRFGGSGYWFLLGFLGHTSRVFEYKSKIPYVEMKKGAISGSNCNGTWDEERKSTDRLSYSVRYYSYRGKDANARLGGYVEKKDLPANAERVTELNELLRKKRQEMEWRPHQLDKSKQQRKIVAMQLEERESNRECFQKEWNEIDVRISTLREKLQALTVKRDAYLRYLLEDYELYRVIGELITLMQFNLAKENGLVVDYRKYCIFLGEHFGQNRFSELAMQLKEALSKEAAQESGAESGAGLKRSRDTARTESARYSPGYFQPAPAGPSDAAAASRTRLPTRGEPAAGSAGAAAAGDARPPAGEEQGKVAEDVAHHHAP